MVTTKKLMGLWAVLLLGTGLTACTTDMETDDINLESGIRLTAIHTGDIHSRLLPYDMDLMATDERLGMSQSNEPFGGIARAATVIRKIRSQAQHSIHVDSGDVFQGAPIFNEYHGEVEIYALNYLGMDAFIIGNHEFDDGVANLYDKLSKAQFQILAANYQWKPSQGNEYLPLKDVARPYTIINAQGIKVGVIGMANYSSMSSSTYGDNSLGITVLENIQLVQSYIDLLQNDVNILTMVTHLGLGEDEDVIRKTVGLDVVFGGHLHVVLNPPKIIPDATTSIVDGREIPNPKMVPLVHSGAFMKYVGHFDGVFYPDYIVRPEIYQNEDIQGKIVDENGNVVADQDYGKLRKWDLTLVSHKYTPIPIESNIQEDAELSLLMAPYERELARRLNLRYIVGYAPQTLKRFGTGGNDSPLGNFLADAMMVRQRVEADFGATNSLGIRTDINQGPVTNDQLYNVFPFPNTVSSMTLSGSEVWSLLDYNTYRSMNRGCQSQLQVSGVRYSLDCHTAKRVVDDYLDMGYLFEYQYRVDIFNDLCRKLDPMPSYCEIQYLDPSNKGLDPSMMDRSKNVYNVHFAKNIEFVRGACETDTDCPYNEDGISFCKVIEDTQLGEYKACVERVQPQWFYKFATNNYMAHGGSGFTTLKYNTTQRDTPVELRAVLLDSIEKQTSCYDRCIEDKVQMTRSYFGDQINTILIAQSPNESSVLRTFMESNGMPSYFIDDAFAQLSINDKYKIILNVFDENNENIRQQASFEMQQNPGSCNRLTNCKQDTAEFELRWCKQMYKYSEQEVCLANHDTTIDGTGPGRCAGLSKTTEYEKCLVTAYADVCGKKFYTRDIEECRELAELGMIEGVTGGQCGSYNINGVSESEYSKCADAYLSQSEYSDCAGLSTTSEYDSCVNDAYAKAEGICMEIACFIASTDGRQNPIRPRNENLEDDDEKLNLSNGPAIMEALQAAGYDACY